VRKLLAAIDFSPVSAAVVEQAASLAEAFSAELTLIHVAAPDPDFVGYAAGPQTVRDDRAREIRTEHRELRAIAEALQDRAISARALLIQGPTVEKILAEGQRLRADVIVIGSHGHGGLYRLLLGSVSEGVVRATRCPVLVVPSAHATDA
jgi:nucleotide-binding universal stress UspA family protein